MIRDLSETLAALLSQPGLPPELSAAQVTFDRPTDPFNPAQTTINLFLFDIRESLELRNSEPDVTRLGGQVQITPPPLRVNCSYLVTAWPVGGADLALQEHRLLSQVIAIISQFPLIPTAFLQGSLVGQTPPVPLLLSQSDWMKNPAEFWTAVGNKMKTGLTITATVSLPVFAIQTEGIVITSELGMQMMGLPLSRQVMYRIGGVVRDAASAPVSGASVLLVERGRTTTTNAQGQFTLSALSAGNFTLRATAGAQTAQSAITIPAPSGSSYDIQFP